MLPEYYYFIGKLASSTCGVCSGVLRGGFGVFKPLPKFQSFDKAPFDCKLSGKSLVFLFQHSSLNIAEFRTPTPQDIQKKGSKILKLPYGSQLFYISNDK